MLVVSIDKDAYKFQALKYTRDGKVVLQVGSNEGHCEFYYLNVNFEFELKNVNFIILFNLDRMLWFKSY